MEGVIGAANWSELLQKARQHGLDAELVARLLTSFGIEAADVIEADGCSAAALWGIGSPLSLADRLCLALGLRLGLPVATADYAWADATGGTEVILIR